MQTASLPPYFIEWVSRIREEEVWIQDQLHAASSQLIIVHKIIGTL